MPRALFLMGKKINPPDYREIERTLPVDIYAAETTGEIFEQLLLRNYPVAVIADGIEGVDIEQLCGAVRFCRSDIAILVVGKLSEETARKFEKVSWGVEFVGEEVSVPDLCLAIQKSLPGFQPSRRALSLAMA